MQWFRYVKRLTNNPINDFYSTVEAKNVLSLCETLSIQKLQRDPKKRKKNNKLKCKGKKMAKKRKQIAVHRPHRRRPR